MLVLHRVNIIFWKGFQARYDACGVAPIDSHDRLMYGMIRDNIVDSLFRTVEAAMIRLAVLYTLGLLMSVTCAAWAATPGLEPPKEGERLPDFALTVPENPDHREYLGLSGQKTFTVEDIGAEVVIIEIFSMY